MVRDLARLSEESVTFQNDLGIYMFHSKHSFTSLCRVAPFRLGRTLQSSAPFLALCTSMYAALPSGCVVLYASHAKAVEQIHSSYHLL